MKLETILPIAHTNLVLLTDIVDTYKKQKVEVADITRACLNALADELLCMKIIDDQVESIILIDSLYEELMVVKNGKKVLYLKLSKALYGYMQIALLLHELYSNILIDMSFTLNPYNLYIVNANKKGK